MDVGARLGSGAPTGSPPHQTVEPPITRFTAISSRGRLGGGIAAAILASILTVGSPARGGTRRVRAGDRSGVTRFNLL